MQHVFCFCDNLINVWDLVGDGGTAKNHQDPFSIHHKREQNTLFQFEIREKPLIQMFGIGKVRDMEKVYRQGDPLSTIYIRSDDEVMYYERRTYSLFEWLGDIGGIM